MAGRPRKPGERAPTRYCQREVSELQPAGDQKQSGKLGRDEAGLPDALSGPRTRRADAVRTAPIAGYGCDTRDRDERSQGRPVNVLCARRASPRAGGWGHFGPSALELQSPMPKGRNTKVTSFGSKGVVYHCGSVTAREVVG